MRVLGFSKKWDKLNQPEFTTCRFPRKDKDWFVGEVVQIVFHPRSKDREVLGQAEIIAKEPKSFQATSANFFTDEEAKADGFYGVATMIAWFVHTYDKLPDRDINKITLRRL